MGAQNIDQKHVAVHSWLLDLFGDVPYFEVNEKTVSRLHNLMKQNIEMDRLGSLRVADLNQEIEEYKLEGKRLHNILDCMGMSPQSLSNAGKASLKNLTQLACSLQIQKTKRSSYLLGLSELQDQLRKIKEEIVEKKQDMRNLETQYKESTMNLAKINSFFENVEESSYVDANVYEKRVKDTKTFIEKSTNYQHQIEDFQTEGDLEEKQEFLKHDVLLQIAQQLDELKKELTPLQKKHKSYRSLPPDINLAKVRIEETKRQLMQLEKQLQTDLDLLTL